ncbi:MAG TPA: TylF/MycF/NovP-related O-methyltransferase [Vicinamibacterales bacterium]|nr:TylF/MycF/NovP-related O-methyltransferase [Vicinamibacterales bacterium]
MPKDESRNPTPASEEEERRWDKALSKRYEHYWYNAPKKIDLRDLEGFGEAAVRIHAEGNTHLHLDRLYTLWQGIMDMPARAAAVIEIGAYQGGSAKFMAEALRHAGRPLPFYVCDTFEGHVEVDATLDPKHKVGVQFQSTSEERVTRYLADCEFVHVVKGDIRDTARRLSLNHELGFVHIDVDVFPITKFCLEFFGPLVSLGAMVVIDDYGFRTCPGAKKAVDDFMIDNTAFRRLHLLTGQAALVRIAV